MLFCKSQILLIFGNFGHFSSLSCRSTPSGSNFRSTRRLYHILQLFWEVHLSSFLPHFSTLAEWCFNNIAFGGSFIFQNFHFFSSWIRKEHQSRRLSFFVGCWLIVSLQNQSEDPSFITMGWAPKIDILVRTEIRALKRKLKSLKFNKWWLHLSQVQWLAGEFRGRYSS